MKICTAVWKINTTSINFNSLDHNEAGLCVLKKFEEIKGANFFIQL